MQLYKNSMFLSDFMKETLSCPLEVVRTIADFFCNGVNYKLSAVASYDKISVFVTQAHEQAQSGGTVQFC